MPPLHIQKINHELNKPTLHIKPLSLSMRKSLNKFSSIAYNSTIAPNKQSNNLAKIWRANLKGAHAIREPPICKSVELKCKP